MKYILLLTIFSVTACALHTSSVTQNNYKGLGNESVSVNDIAQFAPKNLDPKIMNKVQLGLDIRTPSMGYLTEDGKNLYVGWNVTGSSQVWKLDAPMNFPAQLTGGEDHTSMIGMTANGKILLSRDIGGEENPGIYMMNKDGGELHEIFKKKKVQAKPTYIALDGSFFLFSANDQDPAIYTHYRYDLKTNKITEFFNEKGLWAVSDVWSDEKTLIMTKLLGNTASEHYSYNIENKKLVPIIGIGEQEDYSVNFASSTQDFIVQTNKLSNFHRLYHLKNGKLTPISPDLKFDVDSFNLDQKRKRLLYEVNVDGYTKLYGLTLPNFKPLTLPAFPENAEHIFAGRTTRNSRYTTLGVSFHNEPRQSFVYDWNKKTLTRWIRPSTPEIDTRQFTKAKLEYYPARDGTKIPYFVRIPKACEKISCPVIVHFHGGPEGQTQPGFSPHKENFLREGFIYAEPNIRGSSGYGKKWLDADNGAKRLNVITDIEDAGIFLKQKYGAKKIGVMGGSYGGYSTLYAMTRFAGTFDAGVANVGMSSLVTFLMNTAPYRRPLRISEYGDPKKDLEALKELSPITHIDKLKSPLMIVQGVNDPRVPVGEAVQFKKFADQKGIPVELVLFADEGHGASKRNNQAMELTKTIEFFNKYLK
ncbi:MAG: prolyl oligopeptidase family serine peptidase [Bacteriovorax sp.]|nr:prolyl oligopeptidase family serine peptidase [Bacteriovorax sp.]